MTKVPPTFAKNSILHPKSTKIIIIIIKIGVSIHWVYFKSFDGTQIVLGYFVTGGGVQNFL